MDSYRINLDMYKMVYMFPKEQADKIAKARKTILESVDPPIR